MSGLLEIDRLAVPLETYLHDLGDVFTVIRGHDSGCTSYGVDDGTGRWFVKVAHGEAVAQLNSAVRLHARVQHPAIVALRSSFAVCGGRAVVYPWVAGEVLNDPCLPGALRPAHPQSALSRFRRLPTETILTVVDRIVDAHLAVTRRGFVAVDFYDGCVLHDFPTGRTHLVDLDMYRPGPYVLQADRQYGSTRFMAPEEFRRGSVIDERTTVFTLGRTARVLLGEAGQWRGSTSLELVVERATREQQAERFADVESFANAWFGAARSS
ncbi:MAG: hypothetical protein ACR2KL_14240 [Nocardioidaceae bacterium]